MIEFNKIPEVMKAIEAAGTKALTESALIIEGAAKQRSPVKTGQLRNSITHAVNFPLAKIGTDVDYSVYVEYGTSRMAKQPFLRPALDENIAAINAKMKEKYKVAIFEVTR